MEPRSSIPTRRASATCRPFGRCSGVGDFNGDGKSDILWRDTSGDMAFWYMNGTTISSGPGLGTIPTTLTIQNVNAD